MRKIFWIVSLLAITACTDNVDRLRYLKAFSDTYGVVRWFYPGDEAQYVNWDTLAMYGVYQIERVNSESELRDVLRDVYAPFAGVVISENPKFELQSIIPKDTSGMKEIAWQHYGVDLGIWSNSYVSKRTHRTLDSQGLNRLALELALPAASYIGDNLTFSLNIENRSPSSLEVYTKISLDDNNPEEYVNFCDFTTNYRVDDQYNAQIIVGKEDANKLIRIGVYTTGSGQFMINNCQLGTFDLLKSPFIRNEAVYEYSETGATISTKELLFEEFSHVGDVKTIKIIDGLYAHIPLALYGNNEHTYPLLKDNIKRIDYSNIEDLISDREMMIADLIVTWNAVKYFHPYMSDEVKDWNDCLMSALNEVCVCETYSLDPLRRMMANVNDAHFIANSQRESKDYVFLPVWAEKKKDKVIVTKSTDSSICIGDRIILIGRKPAIEKYEECENLISGSPQYKSYIAEQIFPRSYDISTKILLERNGEFINTNVQCIERGEFINKFLYDVKAKPSKWISSDTLYLNTRFTTLAEIKELLDMRQKNQTVLVDIRDGCSFLLENILPYIADTRDLMPFRKGVSQTPKVYVPEPISIRDTLENIQIPEIKYDNIFITGPMNYSHDEEVIDYAIYCGIARTIGKATAGCNGRINKIPLPSGGTVTFTGRKVFSHLGKQGYYYGRGIQ